MNGPRTPAEFRCFALKALPNSDAGTIAALDEVIETIERVYIGEQLAPTPCQAFMGRVFLEAIEEYMAQHQNSFIPAGADITVLEWPKL